MPPSINPARKIGRARSFTFFPEPWYKVSAGPREPAFSSLTEQDYEPQLTQPVPYATALNFRILRRTQNVWENRFLQRELGIWHTHGLGKTLFCMQLIPIFSFQDKRPLLTAEKEERLGIRNFIT